MAIAACVAFAPPASAKAGDGQTHATVPAPACVNNLGEQVRFEAVEREGAALAAGMARRSETGDPVVIRFNYTNAPPEMQAFIDRHECAHHQTGDVDRPHPPRGGPDHLMNESIADCIAILRLRDEEDYDAAGFERVAAALRTDMEKAGFPEISVASRIANIRTCFDDYGPPGDFIEGVLERRR
jgi:hypothetical protein